MYSNERTLLMLLLTHYTALLTSVLEYYSPFSCKTLDIRVFRDELWTLDVDTMFNRDKESLVINFKTHIGNIALTDISNSYRSDAENKKKY